MWSWASGWLIRVSTLDAIMKDDQILKAAILEVVEQYRLLHGMLQVIQEVNGVTGLPICNENTCPTMSAGRYVESRGVMCSIELTNSQVDLYLAGGRPRSQDLGAQVHQPRREVDCQQDP